MRSAFLRKVISPLLIPTKYHWRLSSSILIKNSKFNVFELTTVKLIKLWCTKKGESIDLVRIFIFIDKIFERKLVIKTFNAFMSSLFKWHTALSMYRNCMINTCN